MNEVPQNTMQCVGETGECRWKLPALMALTFAGSESLMCIMSTIFKHDWLQLAVSLCGPIALGVGALLTLKNPADSQQDAPSMVKARDQGYRFLLILSSVYLVTYGFYYAVVQILLREGTGQR